MQNKGHSSKNHPSMPVHVLPDYNRQFNKWESSQSTLFVKYLLFTCFRLQPLLLLQDFFVDCARILSLFLWRSVLFVLLSWTYNGSQQKSLKERKDSSKRSSGMSLAWLKSAPTTESSASVFNPSSCYKTFSLIMFGLYPFSFDKVSCMLCWVEPTLLIKQKIIEAEKGFKQKKLRNAIGLTLVSSYYGIQYCWKCLKETL